jgi:hypothetical protein
LFQLQEFGRDLCLSLNKVFKLPPKRMREGQNVTISNDAMEMHGNKKKISKVSDTVSFYSTGNILGH